MQKAGRVVLDGVRITAGIWYFEVECTACCGIGIGNAVKEEEVMVAVGEEERIGCLIDMDRGQLVCRVKGEEVGSQQFGKVDCVIPVIEVTAGCVGRVVVEKEKWEMEENAKSLSQGIQQQVEVVVVRDELSEDARVLRDVLVKLWDVWDMRAALCTDRRQQLEKVLLEEGRARALLAAPDVSSVLPLLSRVEVPWEEGAVEQIARVCDTTDDRAWLRALLDKLLSHELPSQREAGYRILLQCLRRGEQVLTPQTEPAILRQRALRFMAASRTRLLTKEETVLTSIRTDA